MVIWQLSLTSEARRAENEVPERVEGLHQSVINTVDVWQESEESGSCVVVSAGDEAHLSLLEVSLESKVVSGRKILKDMAHASAIVGKIFSTFFSDILNFQGIINACFIFQKNIM